MTNITIMYCANCGAKLDTNINRPFVFCQYCGSKNKIEAEEIQTTVQLGNIGVTAKTDLDNLISTVEYTIELKQFEKANEILVTTMLSGGDDYRIHICRAMIALHTNRTTLFASLEKIKRVVT